MCTTSGLMRVTSIPVYQRYYSWDIEQCKRLWIDIVDMQKKGKVGHFVGSIVNIAEQAMPTGVQKYMIIDLAIVLADNGCGFTIAPEDAIKPFVSTKPSGGMGLGLNIVNEIMISQGGTLAFPECGDVELPKKYSC